MPDVTFFLDQLHRSYAAYGPLIWVALVGYLLILTQFTYLLFKIDKSRAIAGTWRIPEATLLTFALLGGSIGAKFAQRRFRHKTRKEPFRTTLNLICILQVVAIPVAAILWRS